MAGLAYGDSAPEQWANPAQIIDFFDIKADVVALLNMVGAGSKFDFVAAEHPALQPGQVANILREKNVVGVVGKLHPLVAKIFDLDKGVLVFELNTELTFAATVPVASNVSKFPMIRRDIAVVVDDIISAADLVAAVESAAPDLIQYVKIFDVYRGAGIEAGLKSVALGLILQETSRTLTDDDADAVKSAAVSKLQQEFAAVLRE
jgi:phenylalanyl-tRNA synthetase beta chain